MLIHGTLSDERFCSGSGSFESPEPSIHSSAARAWCWLITRDSSSIHSWNRSLAYYTSLALSKRLVRSRNDQLARSRSDRFAVLYDPSKAATFLCAGWLPLSAVSVVKAEHLASGVYMCVCRVIRLPRESWCWGIRSWEFVNSLHFEWRLWTRKITWKWPMTVSRLIATDYGMSLSSFPVGILSLSLCKPNLLLRIYAWEQLDQIRLSSEYIFVAPQISPADILHFGV